MEFYDLKHSIDQCEQNLGNLIYTFTTSEDHRASMLEHIREQAMIFRRSPGLCLSEAVACLSAHLILRTLHAITICRVPQPSAHPQRH